MKGNYSMQWPPETSRRGSEGSPRLLRKRSRSSPLNRSNPSTSTRFLQIHPLGPGTHLRKLSPPRRVPQNDPFPTPLPGLFLQRPTWGERSSSRSPRLHPWPNLRKIPFVQRPGSSRNLSRTSRSTPCRPGGPSRLALYTVTIAPSPFSACSLTRPSTRQTRRASTIWKITIHCRLLRLSCRSRTPVPAPLQRSLLQLPQILPPSDPPC